MAERNEEEVRRKREEREQQIQKLIAYFDTCSNLEAKGAAALAALIGLELQEDIIDIIRFQTKEALAFTAILEQLKRIQTTPQTEIPEIKILTEKVNNQEREFNRFRKTLETLEAWAQGKFRKWFNDHFGGGL
jgi:hypothetical protein